MSEICCVLYFIARKCPKSVDCWIPNNNLINRSCLQNAIQVCSTLQNTQAQILCCIQFMQGRDESRDHQGARYCSLILCLFLGKRTLQSVPAVFGSQEIFHELGIGVVLCFLISTWACTAPNLHLLGALCCWGITSYRFRTCPCFLCII